MNEPVAVYLDPGFDHDAIERELDQQLGLAPKPPKWRPSKPPLACEHVRVTRVQLGSGLAELTCVCGHCWRESSS